MIASYEERREAGRALRKAVPRGAHGEWAPTGTTRDPIRILEDQAASRAPELVPIRYGRMSVSPFTFFRGGAAIMAHDLATGPTTGLTVQACGDAHVNNFGKFATPERNVVFDINDFDETLPGPWEWDLKRLCASLHVVACGNGVDAANADRIVATASRAYRERLAEFASMRTLERWYERIHIDDVIAHFPPKYRPAVRRDVRKAERKDHFRAVAKLTTTVDGRAQFVEDPPLLVHLSATGHDMDDVMPMIEDYRSTLTDERRHLFDGFRVVDVARKVVGVGSVGTRCWIVLFEGPDHPEGDRMVLQVKEAQPSVLEAHVAPAERTAAHDPADRGPTPGPGPGSGPGHHGRRVVDGQRVTQAASDLFLGWCQAPRSGRQYYVRQLWDVKGQGDTLAMDVNNLSYYGALCAWALARAHARTGDPVQISAYLGRSDRFDRAMVEFSAAYSATNDADFRVFSEAIGDGRLVARKGY